MGPVRTVDLVVPVKALAGAKSRLRGTATDRGAGDAAAHARLALALAHDTVAAARGARRVRRLVVVSSDPVVAAEFAAAGVEVVGEPAGGPGGLNPAVAHGAAVLRAADPAAAVGALSADLPALRPDELDAAIAEAAAGWVRPDAVQRAFCPDAAGTGTTLLLAGPAVALHPRFGAGSALRHRCSGARPLPGCGPGLRRDVDTGDDLRAAADLGLGPHTRSVLAPCAG